MRVKTEAQKDAILNAAIDVFREDGYERASMSKVSRRVGGSKGTLYNYFTSKEELFSAAMLRAINAPAQEAFDILDEFGDKSSAREQLKRFGEAYLHFFLAPDSLEITRLAISEGRNGELGALMYRESVLQGWKKVADFFEERFADLPSHFCDFSEVAMSYRALLSADLTEQMLRGVLKKVDLQTIRAKSHFSATVICDLFK